MLLATALDQATRGLTGPKIPSDNQLNPESLVYYRYGGNASLHMQTRLGEIVPAIRGPNGRLYHDRRLAVYRQPDWVKDPFVASGLSSVPQSPSSLIDSRYAIITRIYGSPRGNVPLAIDLERLRRCVLKSARRYVAIGCDGRDACDRLRQEARILSVLSDISGVPSVYDFIESKDATYLAMEDIDGTPLDRLIQELVCCGRYPPPKSAWRNGRLI